MPVQPGSTINQEISSQVAVGVPFAIAPTGTMAANGAVTLGTALPNTYSGGLYLYLPAGAIVTGSAAGWYFTVMSSATVGQVYNLTYVSGQPVIPTAANLANNAFVTTGPGAFTGVITATVSLNIPLNPNILGPQGFARLTEMFQTNNSAGLKTFLVTIGGVTIYSATATTSAGTTASQFLVNQGSLLVNGATVSSGTPTGVATITSTNIPFVAGGAAVAPSLVVTQTIAVATDVNVLTALLGEFFYNQ